MFPASSTVTVESHYISGWQPAGKVANRDRRSAVVFSGRPGSHRSAGAAGLLRSGFFPLKPINMRSASTVRAAGCGTRLSCSSAFPNLVS